MDSVPEWMQSENYFSQLRNYSRPFILIKLLITELEKGSMGGKWEAEENQSVDLSPFQIAKSWG